MSNIIVGIDEVGRGCWAGPLVVGAVILDREISGLTDSKQLTKVARQALANQILEQSTACLLGWVWPKEVDEIGLTAATTLAIKRAIASLPDYDQIIIDGSYNYLSSNPKASTLIKADALIPAVSAASVYAKVMRDCYMTEQAKLYPEYGFESHVGYGTATHRTALLKHGVTPLHRRSYKPIQVLIN